MSQTSFIISNLTIYTEDRKYDSGFIKIENGIIVEIDDISKLNHNDCLYSKVISLSNDYTLIPGMIDIHIHGVNGVDTMDATPESLYKMARTLPAEGTTSFLATTITQKHENIEKALKNIANYTSEPQKPGVSELLGVHLEGPFISKEKAGAHQLDFITEIDIELFKKWQQLSHNKIKIVTLAPEKKNGIKFISYLKNRGVIASIGHSEANYEKIVSAIHAGATHVTHLFNGMKGIHHRDPYVAGAAILRDELTVEMIVDGIHVRPEIVELAYKNKKSDSIILITDSMRAKRLETGFYELGGQQVKVSHDRVTLENGTLAGSILTMDKALRNFKHYTSCTMDELIKMTSTNPAKSLNIFDRKGSIKVGKDADIVLLNKNLEVEMTFCKGNLSYRRGDIMK